MPQLRLTQLPLHRCALSGAVENVCKQNIDSEVTLSTVLLT